MTRVELTGWNPGLNKVLLNKLLQREAGLSLREALDAVVALLKEDNISIDFDSGRAASSFLAEAQELGAVGHIVDD